MADTQVTLQRRFGRRKDYNGRYTARTRPNTWAENLKSLEASLVTALAAGDTRRIALVERAIAQHRAIDPIAYDRKFGLIP